MTIKLVSRHCQMPLTESYRHASNMVESWGLTTCLALPSHCLSSVQVLRELSLGSSVLC